MDEQILELKKRMSGSSIVKTNKKYTRLICVYTWSFSRLQLFSHFWVFETPLDHIPPGSSIYGILQARILEWIAISSSRRSSHPRDGTQVFPELKAILYHLYHQEAQHKACLILFYYS